MRGSARALGRGVLLFVATTIFALAGYVGGMALVDHQNRGQMTDLADFVLHRAELEVDFAFIGLGELVEAGAASCNQAALGEMRRQVYVRSTIKDIRVVDESGAALCAAFPETLGFDVAIPHQDSAIPGRNALVRLFRLAQTNSASIGVLWQVIPTLSLVAVLNTDALLFEALPHSLQGAASIELALSNGDVVASYSSGAMAAVSIATPFTASSARYPLVLTMSIEAAAFNGWNREILPYFVIPAALIGLAFGVLLARLLVPARTPLSDIDDAIAAGEILAYVQPVFSMETGDIVGCEALARWIKRDGSVVAPDQFVPLVEQSGRIRAFTWTIFRSALTALREDLLADPQLTIAFNIAPSHFLDQHFAKELRELLLQVGVPSKQIILELTERQELADLALGAQLIDTLQRDGFALALDDAGTGHSGLTYVQALGAQILKIDKFFVDAIETSQTAKVIVQMLVGVAHELKMVVVAEGIETAEQMEWLRGIGVEHGQGYHVSRPIPTDAFSRLLRGNTGDQARGPAGAATLGA